MSQKPFMWNSNNPVEWSDPSGYYTFYNGTPEEQNAFAESTKRLDEKVVALLDKTTDPTQRAQLETLHQDLQPGHGSWEVGFGDTRPGKNAETIAHFTISGGKYVTGSLSAGGSRFDFGKLSGSDSKTWMSEISTEAGTYEIESGRVGASYYNQAEAIWQHKVDSGTVGAAGPLGNLTNQLYNGPLGLYPDHP
ncbi:MAG: hypothetical protein WCC84_16815 [Candidatus Cybelea sp.]